MIFAYDKTFWNWFMGYSYLLYFVSNLYLTVISVWYKCFYSFKYGFRLIQGCCWAESISSQWMDYYFCPLHERFSLHSRLSVSNWYFLASSINWKRNTSITFLQYNWHECFFYSGDSDIQDMPFLLIFLVYFFNNEFLADDSARSFEFCTWWSNVSWS